MASGCLFFFCALTPQEKQFTARYSAAVSFFCFPLGSIADMPHILLVREAFQPARRIAGSMRQISVQCGGMSAASIVNVHVAHRTDAVVRRSYCICRHSWKGNPFTAASLLHEVRCAL